jgi:hypothetical protein
MSNDCWMFGEGLGPKMISKGHMNGSDKGTKFCFLF